LVARLRDKPPPAKIHRCLTEVLNLHILRRFVHTDITTERTLVAVAVAGGFVAVGIGDAVALGIDVSVAVGTD
jgi:hypothetical protein